MKTGKQTVSIDGVNFNFKFKTNNTDKGKGVSNEGKRLYIGGKLIKASSDDKYIIVDKMKRRAHIKS